MPGAEQFLARSADNGKLGADVLKWRRLVADHWPRLRFGDQRVESSDGRHSFYVQAFLDELDPEAVHVELYADVQGADPFRQVMTRGELLTGAMNAYGFTASVSSDRPAADFTPRIVPFHSAAAAPLEAQQILWYR